MQRPVVEAENLIRHFGPVKALAGVSLSIQRGEFFSLLGPSGCGKTTLLRLIAGLDFPDSGALRLNGNDLLAVPPHRRPVHTVFQSYALFPHLTVAENVGFGLRMKRLPRVEILERVRAVMELTRIQELSDRKPAQLSGGQKQRVALARALVNEPEVLLLDEPLGALDLKLRKELQHELRTLQRRTGITFIYVTHDQDEALGLSDRIAVMNEGRIVQLGTAQELYERPRTRFVAQFLGGCNLLRAHVCRQDGTDLFLRTEIGEFRVAIESKLAARKTNGQECHLAIRPEKVIITNETGSNACAGEVIETSYTGAETHAMVRIGKETLRVASVNAVGSPRPATGDLIRLVLPPAALIVLED